MCWSARWRMAAERLTSLAGGRTCRSSPIRASWRCTATSYRAILPVEPILVPEGEAAKDWHVLAELLGHLTRLDITRDTPILALGRRVDRRCRRPGRIAVQARMPDHPHPHHLAGPGRQRDRREDRDRLARTEESRRDLPSAVAGHRRSGFPGNARPAAVARRLCRSRQIWPDRRSGVLRLVRSPWRGAARRRSGACARLRSSIASAPNCGSSRKMSKIGRDAGAPQPWTQLRPRHRNSKRTWARSSTARQSRLACAWPLVFRSSSAFARARMRLGLELTSPPSDFRPGSMTWAWRVPAKSFSTRSRATRKRERRASP